MTEEKILRPLFVGLGSSRLAWYRAALPAMYMGADWIGAWGEPPSLKTVTGFSFDQGRGVDFRDYDIVVLQQVRGPRWARLITELRDKGKVVLYEIDDYVHGIRKLPQHDFAHGFKASDLRQIEMCMRMCDGIICATEFLARRYRKFGPTYLCENGLDLARYDLTLPERQDIAGKPSVTIGWAGGTGHAGAVRPWLPVIADLMAKHPNLCFATIGQSFDLPNHNRLLTLPFMGLHDYTAAMTLFDIALAPTQENNFYRGKSDLRAMEAAALGIPVVAGEHYVASVEDGQTGYLTDDLAQGARCLDRLVELEQLRTELGSAARKKARSEFDMAGRVQTWKDAMLTAWRRRNEGD